MPRRKNLFLLALSLSLGILFACNYVRADFKTDVEIVNEQEAFKKNLSGRILLQVEQKGEAWYVNPANLTRYYMGRPDEAFDLIKKLGVGISNSDLAKIPVSNTYACKDGKCPTIGIDSDADKLSDAMEISLGTNPSKGDTDDDGYSDLLELTSAYNPLGSGQAKLDKAFSKKQSGKILLQVEKNGEAWYVDPVTNTRHFLGRPADAFGLMRSLGLGIKDNLLFSIRKPLDKVVSGIFGHGYPAGGPGPYLLLDEQDRHGVSPDHIRLFGGFPFVTPGSRLTLKLLGEEGVVTYGDFPSETKYDYQIVSGEMSLDGSSIFDKCGPSNIFSDMPWYNLVKPEHVSLCYSKKLELVLVAEDNEIKRLWVGDVDTDFYKEGRQGSHNGSYEPVKIDYNLIKKLFSNNESSWSWSDRLIFERFGEMDNKKGTMPVVYKSKKDKKELILEYNLVRHELIFKSLK